MRSTPTPHVATAKTARELSVQFSSAGSRMSHDVTVPAGTQCRKLDGGDNPWVVADLSFIEDKQGLLYWDADHYGIRIPEEELVDITPVSEPGPAFSM